MPYRCVVEHFISMDSSEHKSTSWYNSGSMSVNCWPDSVCSAAILNLSEYRIWFNLNCRNNSETTLLNGCTMPLTKLGTNEYSTKNHYIEYLMLQRTRITRFFFNFSHCHELFRKIVFNQLSLQLFTHKFGIPFSLLDPIIITKFKVPLLQRFIIVSLIKFVTRRFQILVQLLPSEEPVTG